VWFSESMNGSQLIGCLLILLSLVINRLKAITQLMRIR
jgi:drug/metabolite transporter (DMT)-like permease